MVVAFCKMLSGPFHNTLKPSCKIIPFAISCEESQGAH